jgi:hypothetical protein
VADVEPLGGFTVVTLEAGEAPLRALLRGQPDIRVDARVALGLDPTRRISSTRAGTRSGQERIGMNVMNQGAMGFAPDPEVRSKGLRIGCIGAG